ncbi:DNA topology modulation protein [Paenibacillus montaniterrae]|uniref:DNA topology modulation protein n=1 Tax=Paenibacillus montaniterrae TaxID=429341 RepID=A0A919YQD4_9BACL|nr:AAA family ATPase [Paenibacillus montaniterrae]GIP17500.1 DNA topology modulation protein [Paenibacillus montaniterrae]
MKKIFIVGIVASGKTTLAKQLSKSLNIPWYELNCIVHNDTKEGRKKRSSEEQVEIIKEIDEKGSWIFEGTDRESYRCLYDMAEVIIFLDPPLWKRKIRILTRFIKQKIGIEKSHYKPDITMLKLMYKWTSDFERNRNEFELKIKRYQEKVIKLGNIKNLKM